MRSPPTASPIGKGPRSGGRLMELDALRGIAAVLVVIYHYGLHYDEIYGTPSALQEALVVGKYGVHLFFMISGFVILMTLEKTRRPLDFVMSRFARLFPAYWLSVVLTFSVLSALELRGWECSFQDALLNLTMVPESFGIPPVDGSYWTLAIELRFYALLFALSLLGLTARIEILALLWVGIQIAFWIVSQITGSPTADLLNSLLILPYANLFVAGMSFYRVRFEGGTWLRHGTIAISLLTSFLIGDLTVAVTASAFFLVFYLFTYGRLGWIVRVPTLYLGSISYSLYLVHQYIGYAIIQQLGARGVGMGWGILVAATVALGFSSLITFYWEQPARRWILDRCGARSRKASEDFISERAGAEFGPKGVDASGLNQSRA